MKYGAARAIRTACAGHGGPTNDVGRQSARRFRCGGRRLSQAAKSDAYTKGQSGNPTGRPRGRHRQAPYEAILGQIVKIRENGAERPVTAAEAFLLQLTKRGLEGDDGAARASLAVIEQAREGQDPPGQSRIGAIVHVIVTPGSVTSALEPLRMARKLDPYRETARMSLEPWLVETALAGSPSRSVPPISGSS
jgi:hypothetical protein